MGTELSDRTLQRIALAMLVLLLLVLAVGVLVPIYTDEVGWRFQLSRYVQDGWLDHNTSESCGANTTIAPPWSMVPVRLFSSAVTALGFGPLAVRLTGVGFAMLGVLLARVAVRRAATGARERAMLEALFYALMGIGLLPFLLVWSRPEQPVWLMLAGAAAIALAPRAASAREPLAVSAAIAALAAIALSYHLKSLFYLPLFVAALWIAGRGAARWQLRAALTALVLLLGATAFSYWTRRFACPADPVLAAKIASESVAPLMLHGSGGAMWRMLPELARLAAPGLYVELVLPGHEPMSHWLVAPRLPGAVVLTWSGLAYLAWHALIALVVAAIAVALVRRTRPRPAQLIGLVLMMGALAWGATQLHKNDYEAALYLPVLALGALLLLAGTPAIARWVQWVMVGVAAISVASQLLLVAHYAPRLWRADMAGTIAGQPFSISPFGYAEVRREALAAGAKCGFNPPASQHRLLIDDASYFAYSASRYPMHRLGVLTEWRGNIRDPLEWMRARGSPGAVVACDELTPAMRAIARQAGAFCCLRTH